MNAQQKMARAGGKARAAALSPERRSAIAAHAAAVRDGKKPKKSTSGHEKRMPVEDLVTRRLILLILDTISTYAASQPDCVADLANEGPLVEEICSRIVDTLHAEVI